MAEVRLDVDLAHTPQWVWRALTEPDVVNRWFIPGGWAVVAGAQFRISPGKDSGIEGPVDVEVLEVVAGRRLVMQWSADTLHAEMTWELSATGSGCRLSVVQEGFLGTPQSVRARQLRAAYWQMFARSLPGVLATAAAEGGAVPRPADPGRPAGVRSVLRTGGGAAGRVARRLRGWLSRWEGIATAIATAAVVALAVVLVRAGAMGEAQPAAPPDPIAQPADVGAPTPTAAAQSTAPAGGHGGNATQPNRTRTPTAAPVTSPTRVGAGGAPAPVGRLSATYQTLKVLANGNYTAQVTMTATGGDVTGWTVVITVPDGAVVAQTSGASAAQNGGTATFTPAGNAQVGAGQIVSFTFRVRKPAGTTAPLSCTANERPCAGL